MRREGRIWRCVWEIGAHKTTSHGPQSNPRLIAANLVSVSAKWAPGRRLWVYFRGGRAVFASVWWDRRTAS
jgi:hypothetical protein